MAGTWATEPQGPPVLDVALATIDTVTDSASRVATDAFLAWPEGLRRSLVAQRCALGGGGRGDDLEFLPGAVGFDDLDEQQAQRMREMPTRLVLPKGDVDAAVAAG